MGQHIRVDAHQEPLNRVLIRMAEEHGIQMSFDDRLLSQYMVTLHQQFETAEEAIACLLEPLPLEYQNINEVYIIFKKKAGPDPDEYLLSGRIIDKLSGESLPYTHLLIDQQGTTTDFSGHFSATSTNAPVFSLTVSHLGYYLLDTVLQAGHDHVLGLTPSVFELEDVYIQGRIVERSGQVGEEAGALRLNHKVAYRLPGNGDDAIFNFLRLQPGILAAGEQSSEMIIWGGYPGNSQLLFDGFTIFGPRNFNDNISFVNPYMTKEIRVLKGGYPAEYGDRIGGIVEVTGIEGSRVKPTLNLNINNMTVSGMAGLPVREKATLTAAFRHTYYNLYSAENLGVIINRVDGGPNSGIDLTVQPDYRFRDANLKYAGSTGKGDPYYISLYSGGDLFSYTAEEEKNRLRITQDATEKSRQLGGTAFYGRTWKNGSLSNFSLSYSGMNRDLSESQEIYHMQQGFMVSREATHYRSSISEVNLRNINHFNLREKHNLLAGAGYVYYSHILQQNSEDVIPSSSLKQEGRINLFVQDEYHPTSSVSLKPGIRIDRPLHLQHLFIQPRFQFSVKLGESWKINGAWGIYNQFIAETTILDELGNYRYFWAISDSETIPVLQAQHLVGGGVFHQGGFTLSVEPFYKTVQGMTRLVDLGGDIQEIFHGQARIYGTDLLVKQYFGKHEGWVSYTLSRAEEHFPYFSNDNYAEAPQDQRHEIKGAFLVDFKPVYLSVNYVYGSGLAYRSSLLPGPVERYPYSRLDASFIYRFKMERVRMEAGLSILNLLNRENIKYSNLFQVPDGQFSSISIHAEAVPFTPTLYVNLAF
ncbi:MAG: TonB-dependent receptor plug domain-containing protein [Bacteroidota bacterium]